MMINTSKYDKSFIFLVYNVIMIISTVSFNITAEPNISNTDKYAPDYDMIQIEDLPDYYKYYFRPSVYAGQLKIFPVMFFRSIYNCKYLVLPDLKDRYDYGEYSQKFYERLLNLNHQYKTSNKIIKKQENNYDKLLANYSKVTKEAYDAVKKYEDPVEMDNRDSNRKLKDEAVQTYLNTEMEISSDEELHDEFKYIYANYEVHAYPTEKIFYPSTVRQSENDNSLQTLFFNCNNLNAGEYHEVMFLYKFISIIKEDESFFTTTILNILITLGQCVPVKLHPLLKDYTGILNKEETKNSDKGESEKEEIGNSDNVCKDYESETEMFKKKFIVNNENEMSYLVRLKIMGYVGFDFTNTDLYRKKKDFRAGYYIDMDINTKTELSEDFKSDKDGI